MTPSRAALVAACAAAAFAAFSRVFGLWTGDLAVGARLAVACGTGGLTAAFLLPAPSAASAPWRALAAALAGPASAVWLRAAGLSASDPGLLAYGAAAPLPPLLAAATASFFMLGLSARDARASGALEAAAAPLALLAAHAALERADAALVLALSTPALLLGAPRRRHALAGLLLASAGAWTARTGLRDVWTLRLDHLFTGWYWRMPPAGAEGLAVVNFPDTRLATLRAGRLSFEDTAAPRLTLLALFGQCEAPPASLLLVAPRSPALPGAAQAAGLTSVVVTDPSPQADRVMAALWTVPGVPAPDPAWNAARGAPAGNAFDLFVVRVPGAGRPAERAGLADRRALRAWRRSLSATAPAALLFSGGASPRDVASAAADAREVFGHSRVLDLPTGVAVVAAPAPVITDIGAISARLPVSVRLGWDPEPTLQRAMSWRPDEAGK